MDNGQWPNNVDMSQQSTDGQSTKQQQKQLQRWMNKATKNQLWTHRMDIWTNEMDIQADKIDTWTDKMVIWTNKINIWTDETTKRKSRQKLE